MYGVVQKLNCHKTFAQQYQRPSQTFCFNESTCNVVHDTKEPPYTQNLLAHSTEDQQYMSLFRKTPYYTAAGTKVSAAVITHYQQQQQEQ